MSDDDIAWRGTCHALILLLLLTAGGATASAEPITVTFLQGYDPDLPESPVTRQILALPRAEPRLNPQKWGGLTLPGAGGRAPFMLSLAGGTAPVAASNGPTPWNFHGSRSAGA